MFTKLTVTLQAGAQMLAWPLRRLVHCFICAHKEGVHGTRARTLSSHSTSAVSETLTNVSVEASKQRNNREEKNQSTRRITPVQKPKTRSSEQLQSGVLTGARTLDTFLATSQNGSSCGNTMFPTGTRCVLTTDNEGYQLQFATTAIS